MEERKKSKSAEKCIGGKSGSSQFYGARKKRRSRMERGKRTFSASVVLSIACTENKNAFDTARRTEEGITEGNNIRV